MLANTNNMYHNLPLNRTGLSFTKGITLDVVKDIELLNATGEWDWMGISIRAKIAEVKANPELPWSKGGLSRNRGITVDLINTLSLVDTPNDWWEYISISAFIDISEVWAHPEFMWNKLGLSRNKGITLDLIHNLELPNAINGWDWEWESISQFINIAEVLAHPELPWNREGLSRNKGITIDLIHNLKLPNAVAEWDWFRISQVINIAEVWKHPELPWDREGLSRNKGITVNLIHNLELPNAKYIWDWFCMSMFIDISEVVAHPNLPWNREGLSQNKGITIDLIQEIPLPAATKYWDWFAISRNFNISLLI